jgi:hypothetical protein
METSVRLLTRATENRDTRAYLTNINYALRMMPGYVYGNGQPFRPILHIFK